MGIPNDRPVISVVVATFGRGRRLSELIASLEAQDIDEPYEIILVDDGSPAESRELVEAVARQASIPVRAILLDDNAGPARGRNRGWREARADLVVFTDDDCSPDPGWLGAMVLALRRYDFVQGRTEPNPDQADRAGPFSRTVSVGGENGFYETCNMGYRRTLLERMGGFDEGFRLAAGEDTDLGCRARAAGATFSYQQSALVYHDVVDRGFFGYIHNTRRWAGVVRVVRLHPELKRFFSRGPFWLRSHNLAVLGACGFALAIAERRRVWLAVLALGLGVPYAHYRLRKRPVPGAGVGRLTSLPAVWIGDLTEAFIHVASVVRFKMWRT